MVNMGFWRANGVPYIWDGDEWEMSYPSMVSQFMLMELIAYDVFSIKDFVNSTMTPFEVYLVLTTDPADGHGYLMESYDAWIRDQITKELSRKMKAGRDFDAFGIHFVWVESQDAKRGRR